MGIVNKVRGTVDKALDTAINFVVNKAKKLFGRLFTKKSPGHDVNKDLQGAVTEAESAAIKNPSLEGIGGQLSAIQAKYGLSSLTVKSVKEDAIHIEAVINPKKDKDRQLDDVQKLAKCEASRKHGKKVKLVGHGDPKAASAKVKSLVAKERKAIEGLQTKIELMRSRLRTIVQDAKAKGVKNKDIKTMTGELETNIDELKGKIVGHENNIKGFEHEEKVAKAEKAIMRNLTVRCVACGLKITDLDVITDKGIVLEAKVSSKIVDVEQIVRQRHAVEQELGKAYTVMLALPAGFDKVGLAQKFRDKGVEQPPVREY